MSSETSRLLQIREQYVSFSKPLAVMLTPTRAMLLEHLHFWIQNVKGKRLSKCLFNGRYWWYHSLPQWHKDFPFYTTRTIQRALADLEKEGLIEKSNTLNSGAAWSDQTNWYTTNGSEIDQVFKEGLKSIKDKGAPTTKCRDDMTTKCRDDSTTKCRDKDIKEEDSKETIETARQKSVGTVARTSSSNLSSKFLKSDTREADLKRYTKRFNENETVPSVAGLWKLYVTQYHGAKAYMKFTTIDTRNTKSFIKWCKESGVPLPIFLEWIVSNWEYVTEQLDWAKLDDIPVYKNVYSLRDKMMALYKKGARKTGGIPKKTKQTFTKVSQVPKNHPHYKAMCVLIKKHGSAIG